MNALPSNDTNNLSPLVVSRPNIPLLGDPPGTFFSQKYTTVIHKAIKIKKIAVGHVQAIHVIKSKSKRPFSLGWPTVDQLDAYKFLKIILFPLQIPLLYNFLQNKLL